MLIAAAVCPHPPLLVPEVTGASDPAVRELRRLRTACRDAVAVLIGAAPDLLVVAGGAGQTAEYPALPPPGGTTPPSPPGPGGSPSPPGPGGSLRDFGVPFTVGADPVLPLSLTIGKWLLAEAVPPAPPVSWQAIASGSATADCLSLGEELALALGGEVVNADSMQLYQGMDIGTAKEPEAARRGVPHHLLDIWPVTQTANVADYAKLARAAIDEIIARGRVPVLAGGSGLYVRAALA